MSAVQKKPPKKVAAASHCLECNRPISGKSNHTYFCSKDCAADWGDDEAHMQFLAARENQKKANAFVARLRPRVRWAQKKEPKP